MDYVDVNVMPYDRAESSVKKNTTEIGHLEINSQMACPN
jgi:hypothetical protein